jgi:hypothetical protein
MFVDQGNRPDSSYPHKIYHYYKKAEDVAIKIKIIDNWEAFNEWP